MLGRPVLTTIPGLINNEVDKYNLGISAKAGNPDDLASSVKKLFLSDKKNRDQMSINARKLAETKYSRNLLAKSFTK